MARLYSLAFSLFLIACVDSRTSCRCTVGTDHGACGSTFCASGTEYQCTGGTATPIGACSSVDAGGGDASSCFCRDTVEGTAVAIPCGGMQCVNGSNYSCSSGSVSGLLLRTGPCTDAGSASGSCPSACAACSAVCNGCDSLETLMSGVGCGSVFQAYLNCGVENCSDTSVCTSIGVEMAACACPGIVPMLQSQAAGCGTSVRASCASDLERAFAIGCAQLYQTMGCAAFTMSVCTGGGAP